MIARFKKGLSFIAVGLVTLVLDRIFGWLEPLLIDSVTEIWSVNPLLIIEIIALSIMSIGVVLIFLEKYGWFKKQAVSDDIKQYNVKKPHSKEIARALEIMSKGYYDEEYGEIQFLVPYPYSEYLKDERKTNFPTPSEIIELFNKHDWSDADPKKYDFVPLDRSPEAKFEWVMQHLESYDDIKEKLQRAEKAQTRWIKFCKENSKQIMEHHKNILSTTEKHGTFHSLYVKMVQETNDPLKELQESMQILYYNLKHGEIIKGKCKLGY